MATESKELVISNYFVFIADTGNTTEASKNHARQYQKVKHIPVSSLAIVCDCIHTRMHACVLACM